jgi:hypothetical protein
MKGYHHITKLRWCFRTESKLNVFISMYFDVNDISPYKKNHILIFYIEFVLILHYRKLR